MKEEMRLKEQFENLMVQLSYAYIEAISDEAALPGIDAVDAQVIETTAMPDIYEVAEEDMNLYLK